MNIVNKVTIRHLQKNKRRTLVTILGTIISVAMVTAVATLGISFLDLMKRQTIAEQGEWHVLYKDVNKDQLEGIKNDEATQAVVVTRERGYALLEGGENENKPYLFLEEYNAEGFAHFPIEVSKGRLPQAENELLLSEEIATNARVTYEIGDRLTLDLGERIVMDEDENKQVLDQSFSLQLQEGEKEETLTRQTTASYTVVGFIKRPNWEPAWAPGYTVISYVDESTLNAEDRVDAAVILKKVNRSLYSHAEELAAQLNIATVHFNNGLLRYYGITNNDNLRSTLYSLSAIIMAVIVIGSIALIYNAFAISVSERSRYLGMLSSVGATKRQKRNSVFFEGLITGLISIPIGIIGGLVGIGITFWFINSIIEGALGVTEKLTVVVTPLSLLVASAISMVTILISTYLPARRASRISAMDAIRQTTDLKLTGKAVQTSKLIRKLFGIEAEIGLKNLKRNKGKYRVTVFSLVISIILFLTVSSFTSNLEKAIELSQDGINYDIRVFMASEYAQPDEQMSRLVAQLDDVTESSVMKKIQMATWIEEEAIAEPLQELVEQDRSILEDGKYPYYVQLHGLNERNFQTYAQQIGIDHELLQDQEKAMAIVIDTIVFEDWEEGKYVETKAIQANLGDTLDLYLDEWETGEKIYANQVEIAALTDQYPMGILPAGIGGVDVIVSEEVLNQLIGAKTHPDMWTYLYLKSSNPMATQQQIEELKENYMMVHNAYQMRQREEQMILLMSVFTYGFITLITLISIANIFNTISTGISLRKREFAMLRSVGMTPAGFYKMINYESIFYGLKSLLYGLPISVVIMYFIHRSLMSTFSYGFTLPWISIISVIAAVFIIVCSAMLYSISKVKKENIIDALKQENI